MNKRRIIAFDFDGTLIKKDSFIEFIKFCFGRWKLYWGIGICSPIIMAYKIGILPNWKAKEFVFSFFFKGMSYNEFCAKGKLFSSILDQLIKPNQATILETCLKNSDTVYVISASIKEWVRPWCEIHGVNNVLTTEISIDGMGMLTGQFSNKNCHGQEKVRRLIAAEPYRNDYYLIAYGDSGGDKELLNFANEGYLVK